MKLGPIAIIFWLLSPFLILAGHVTEVKSISFPELLWAFQNTFYQSLASALVSLGLGIGGLGLLFWVRLKWGSKFRLLLEIFLVLPCLLPPIFVLLALLNVLQPFPYGVVGIVIVHAAMNAGLAAVVLTRLLEASSQGLMDLCWVEGVRPVQFLRVSLFGYLRSSLGALFLMIFALCFTSFSVPLIVAGSRGTTIEVLIYEKIQIDGDLGAALSLSFIQTFFIFILSLFLKRSELPNLRPSRPQPLLAKPLWGLPVLVISVSILFSSASGWFSGWHRLAQLPDLMELLPKAILGSFAVGTGAGLFCFLVLQALIYFSPSKLLERFFLGYIAPSAVLASFAYLLISSNAPLLAFVRLIFVLVLLFIPTIYRLGFHNQLEQLAGQLRVAELMGATRSERYWAISLPQSAPLSGWLSGVLAFWAVGDFAISRILVGGDRTLALVVDSLMSFYRIDLALSLSSLLLTIGLVMILIFGGLGYVSGRKTIL